MFPMYIDADLELRPFTTADTEAFFALILANRERLDRWMRWTGRIQTLDDARVYIQGFENKLAAGDAFHAGLWLRSEFENEIKDELTGGLACYFFSRESGKCEIGYWLDEHYTGQRIVTRACRVVIDYLFTQERWHRIEIQTMTTNRPSRAIAERLGFTLEGIKRESEWITDAFQDHALYSLLAREWQPN